MSDEQHTSAEEPLSEDDLRVVERSREYFRSGGEDVPFEQVVTDCGFTMDEIRNANTEALLSEPVLEKDWLTPEEVAACDDLRHPPSA